MQKNTSQHYREKGVARLVAPAHSCGRPWLYDEHAPESRLIGPMFDAATRQNVLNIDSL